MKMLERIGDNRRRNPAAFAAVEIILLAAIQSREDGGLRPAALQAGRALDATGRIGHSVA